MTVQWDSGALSKKGKTHTVRFLSSAAFRSQQLLLAAGRKPDGECRSSVCLLLSEWENIPETCADHLNGGFTQLTLIYKLPCRHVQGFVSYVILEPVKSIKLMTIIINHN